MANKKARYFVIGYEVELKHKSEALKELQTECRSNPGDVYYLCEVLQEAEATFEPPPVEIKDF